MSNNKLRDKGVIYYATGQKYLEEAKESARSLKKHSSLHITVFTDIKNIETEIFDNIENIDPGEHPFYDRINYFKKSPYQKTLHLDTDTYITGDITPIFEMLDRFDIVASINETRDTVARHTKFETLNLNIPKAFPEYQCGVIGFNKNSETKTILEEWQNRYAKYKDQNVLDQPFFRETLYQNKNVQVGTLPSEYNLLVNFPGYLQQSAKIIHFGGEGRDNPEKIAEEINALKGEQRIYSTNLYNLCLLGSNDDFRFKLLRSIYENGFLGSIKKIFQSKLAR
jgi:hypothetical protein